MDSGNRKIHIYLLILGTVQKFKFGFGITMGQNQLIDCFHTLFCTVMYKFSTFFLAQGVFRKNLRLDFTEGSLVKHPILMRSPNTSHP